MLSDHIRPNSEAAPWVIDEVVNLEKALRKFANFPLEAFGHDKRPDDYPLFAANNWQLTVGDVKLARRLTKEARVGTIGCTHCLELIGHKRYCITQGINIQL